jgi:hypothetical protein
MPINISHCPHKGLTIIAYGMNTLWPNRTQWKRWSLPARWGFIGGILAVIGTVLAIGIPLIQKWLDPSPDVVNVLNRQEKSLTEIKALLTEVSNIEYRELVAEVIHSFNPSADIMVGSAVQGLDGGRNVDVTVHAIIDGVPKTLVIDVVDLPPGKKAGVDTVDALDSKRSDIHADLAVICSNTGFDSIAIRKAKRKQIGLISVLHQGDSRVKAVIEEEIYLRKISLGPMQVSYDGNSLPPIPKNLRTHELRYKGHSVDAWLQQQAALFATGRPESTKPMTLQYKLRRPTIFEIRDQRVTLDSFSITFNPRTQWLAQTVILDAKNGVYDYLRGRVRLAPGANSYVIKGINFDTATPLSTQPIFTNQGVSYVPGEVDISLTMVEGLDLPAGTEIPKLEDIVRPEDLRPILPPL